MAGSQPSLRLLRRVSEAHAAGDPDRRAAAALGAALLALLAGCAAAAPSPPFPAPGARRFEKLASFRAEAARQGPAVDADHVYAVGNRRIQKLDKRTRVLLGEWPARDAGPGGVVHLNSGVVIDGRLYCAHSNYPEVPMASSVEIFDPVRMQHIGSHSFGIAYGSATWVDRRDGHWWVGFAHYEGRGGVPGMGPAWTRVVEFDAAWRRVAGYVFPPEVVERFGTRSNSGGAWGPDGLLYATGHDEPEVYVLRLPAAGSVLELVEILPITATGQGIAWDPSQPDVLYTIVKREREIVASRLVAD